MLIVPATQEAKGESLERTSWKRTEATLMSPHLKNILSAANK
jgi:hypothetical protein